MINDKQRRKEIGKQYTQTHRPMGIYKLKNNVNGKMLIGSSMDLPGMFNRLKFSLNSGVWMNKELQREWSEYGEDQFSFEIVEQIKPQEEMIGSVDELDKYKKELELMEQMWLEELQPYGEQGYNKKPKHH